MTLQAHFESHEQLRALYHALLSSQECFDEFKHLLQLYGVDSQHNDGVEPADATAVRQHLNDRIRTWIGGGFDGLTATQTLEWRAIIVEERFNASVSPWRISRAS
jgi:hypothetical protein